MERLNCTLEFAFWMHLPGGSPARQIEQFSTKDHPSQSKRHCNFYITDKTCVGSVSTSSHWTSALVISNYSHRVSIVLVVLDQSCGGWESRPPSLCDGVALSEFIHCVHSLFSLIDSLHLGKSVLWERCTYPCLLHYRNAVSNLITKALLWYMMSSGDKWKLCACEYVCLHVKMMNTLSAALAEEGVVGGFMLLRCFLELF